MYRLCDVRTQIRQRYCSDSSLFAFQRSCDMSITKQTSLLAYHVGNVWPVPGYSRRRDAGRSIAACSTIATLLRQTYWVGAGFQAQKKRVLSALEYTKPFKRTTRLLTQSSTCSRSGARSPATNRSAHSSSSTTPRRRKRIPTKAQGVL